MGSGMNDMAQTMEVTINGTRLCLQCTKEAVKFLKNLAMLLAHAGGKGIDFGMKVHKYNLKNAKGFVSTRKMNAISMNQGVVKFPRNEESKAYFESLLKEYGIPASIVNDNENLFEYEKDGKAQKILDSNGKAKKELQHVVFPKEQADKMVELMKKMEAFEIKRNLANGQSLEDARANAKDDVGFVGDNPLIESKSKEVPLLENRSNGKSKKLPENIEFVRVSNDDKIKNHFKSLCKKAGIDITEVPGLKKSDVSHFIYDAKCTQKMEGILEKLHDFVEKIFKKDGVSKDEITRLNRKESIEEAGRDLGCDMPNKEFKEKFFSSLATPQEKLMYTEVDKKKQNLSTDKKEKVQKAVNRNGNAHRAEKFKLDGMYSVAFNKDQIIGTVERNNEKFLKVRFENDYSQAFLVNEKNIAKKGDTLYGAFTRDGDITIFNLKRNSEKTVSFKKFMSESETKSTAKSEDRTKNKSESKSVGSSVPAVAKGKSRGRGAKAV